MNISDLKIGKWYKSHNILFMPVEYSDDTSLPRAFGSYPDRMVKLVYLQSASHMSVLDISLLWWEEHIRENREFLYHSDSENVLNSTDIESVSVKDFRDIIKAFFEAEKWHSGASTQYIKPFSKEGLDLLREIIKEIRGT